MRTSSSGTPSKALSACFATNKSVGWRRSCSFIKAKPGTEVEISLKNEGEALHTFTIDETKTNVELAAGETSSVKVTLPASGALAFYCSLNRGSGMQGAFSVSAAAAPSGATTTVASSGGGYGY